MSTRTSFRPAPLLLWLVGAAALLALLGLLLGMPRGTVADGAWLLSGLLALAAALDALLSQRAWVGAAVVLRRDLPHAFALGVKQQVALRLRQAGARSWRLQLHDHPAAMLGATGLPLTLRLPAQSELACGYPVVPVARGVAPFAAAQLRVSTRWRLGQLCVRVGECESRRIFPDFAQVARYAWLAGDRRLAEIGIKTLQRRGSGTDFKQLTDYRPGDAIRHVDWKATQRASRLIVREFQDERDQQVMLLLDCGRRMRAAEREGLGHFDSVLNAVVLLAYVALRQGDAVGVQTFATEAADERYLAPIKGARALDQLLAGLYDVQPSLVQPDYLAAASSFMRRQSRRSLVVLVTNFRDEDAAELRQALRVLRTRHLVLLASLREQVVGQLIGQPIDTAEAVLQVASAQLYEQQRALSFARMAARDALMVDADPARLGVELVNRYRAAKNAGLI